ncbi:MAG: TrmB family transcriptional regulator [Haloarculaceae archaeon]
MGLTSDESRAIEALQAVGLTLNEARCLVALTKLDSGTAAEISEHSNVPRTRVYDLGERLGERGLVEISDGTPRRFRAVPIDLAMRTFERNFAAHLETAEDALRSIEKAGKASSASGVWSIEGRENVAQRSQYLLTRANEEVFGYVTEDAALCDECYRAGRSAIDRGVDVIVGSSSDAVSEEISRRLPGATIWHPFDDLAPLETRGATLTGLLMADRDVVLLSSISETATGREETAIWSDGADTELTLLVRRLVGASLDERTCDDDTEPTP